MPTTTEKLTANFLKLRTKKPGKYGDGNNLWLIVGPTGRERWELRFTFGGKSREMSLGPVDLIGNARLRPRSPLADQGLLLDPRLSSVTGLNWSVRRLGGLSRPDANGSAPGGYPQSMVRALIARGVPINLR